MSDCMLTLRRAVEDFNAKRLDRDQFRDRVLECLSDHMDSDFAEKDRTIILNLLDRMKEEGMADAEFLDDLSDHFADAGGSVEDGGGDAGEQTFGFESSSPGLGRQGPVHPHPSHPQGPPPQGWRPMDHPAAQAKSLHGLTTWYAWLMGIGAPLSVIPILNIIGGVMVLAAVVIGSILLFSYWHYLQGGRVRTTPLKAVGFHFVIVFNWYWFFVSFWGLARDMADYIRDRNLRAYPPNPTLSLVFCILMLVPLLAMLVAGTALWGDPRFSSMEGFRDLMDNDPILLGLQIFNGLVQVGGYVLSIFMFRDFTTSMSAILMSEPLKQRPRYSGLAVLLVCGVLAWIALFVVLTMAVVMFFASQGGLQ